MPETEELTAEQEAKVAQGICPYCNHPMDKLTPTSNPKKSEFHCSPCHWSYPLFARY